MATALGNTPNPIGRYTAGSVPSRASSIVAALATREGQVKSQAHRLPNNLDTATVGGPIEGQIYPRPT